MKKTLVALTLLAMSSFALAQRVNDVNGNHAQLHPTKDKAIGWARPGGGGAQDISYHGGPVIVSAKHVSIFWGSSWADGSGNLNAVASEMLGFFAQFGSSGEYKTIKQYSGIQATNLTNTFWWDSSAPPTNVTDTAIRNEVIRYFTNGGGSPDASTQTASGPAGSSSRSRRSSCWTCPR